MGFRCQSCNYEYAPYPWGLHYPDDNGICSSCGKRADFGPLVAFVKDLPEFLEEVAAENPEHAERLMETAKKIREMS
jgi:hypothetical protein